MKDLRLCGYIYTSPPSEQQGFAEWVFEVTGASQDSTRGFENASVNASLSSVVPFFSGGFYWAMERVPCFQYRKLDGTEIVCIQV